VQPPTSWLAVLKMSESRAQCVARNIRRSMSGSQATAWKPCCISYWIDVISVTEISVQALWSQGLFGHGLSKGRLNLPSRFCLASESQDIVHSRLHARENPFPAIPDISLQWSHHVEICELENHACNFTSDLIFSFFNGLEMDNPHQTLGGAQRRS
jgi:hypothetical protein